MWNLLRAARRDDPDFAMNIQDLLEATQRNIVFGMAGLFLAGLFWLTTSSPELYTMEASPFMLGLLLLSMIVLWVIQRGWMLTAQVIWQVGLVGLIAFGLAIFQVPEVLLSLALLPLMASMTIGWWFALLVQLMVSGVAYLLIGQPGMPAVPVPYLPVVVVGGLAAGLLGWAATHALLTLSGWAMTSFHHARQNVEDARRQRQELFQVQEDLLQANRELARLTNRLKVLTQAAEEARRVKEEFVANVSHELRTPLNMVIGFCEVIADSPRVYGNLPQALLADIAAIKRNGHHLSELVNDVLDLSQIEAGRMALTKDWTTVQEIITAAIEAVNALFESKGLYLKALVEEEPIPLFCDSTRMREVLLNLLSNAGRFTEEGGVNIRVWHNANMLTVCVEDTGPGISAENQKKLFEPFQQLDNSLRRRGGSGLGLSISKRFVEMHNGRMWVTSEIGVGTSFFFEIPLEMPLENASEVSNARRWVNPYMPVERPFRRSKAPLAPLVPRYVLLESGDALCRLFQRYFHGVEFVQVRDLPCALEELSRSPSQALVLNRLNNKHLPELDAQLADLPFGASLIECWVAGDDPSHLDGVARYLTKPVKRADLLWSLDQLGRDVQTVLIVDDQPEILQLFARMLASAEREYTAIRAKHGRTALDLLRSRKPDVMLLDLLMPEFDGFDVLREKNADEAIRDIPVIVISANDPSGTPIISDHLSFRRSSGFSAREFLESIQAVSEILSPKATLDDRAQPIDLDV